MKSNNPRKPTDTSALSGDDATESASATTATSQPAPSLPDATTEALLQTVIAIAPHELQPDLVASVGDLPRAPLALDPLLMLGGGIQDSAAQIAAAINGFTAVLQQILPAVQAALAKAQQPAAESPPAVASERPAPAEDEDDDDDWKPRFINMPPPPGFGMPRGAGRVPPGFARMHRLIRRGSWDEIEAEYRRGSGGEAMPEDIRARIAKVRKELGLSGPPKREVAWPMPESTKAIPFTLTPEMMLAPLRADLAKHGKPGGQPPAAAAEDADTSGEIPADSPDHPDAPGNEGMIPNRRKKPPSDLN
jgi:hypothetical protein